MTSSLVKQPNRRTQTFAPGMKVVVRDEEWLITNVEHADTGAQLLQVRGMSELVRDTDAAFFTDLDKVEAIRPEDTRFVHDSTSKYLHSRLYIDAMLRSLPVPRSDSAFHVAKQQLLDPLSYQLLPAQKAIAAPQPRILIADAVGLGKTLEIGLLLGELIRRGRGERILVITPQHILEQFQQELWTRFAIPLVRLDSAGVARIREQIPATRNPFSYFRRAIISIDTLKSDQYKVHLERSRWDAVVIDECHAVMNNATLNAKLAKRLAPTTDALILASATPHNGKAESFANLIELLDPVAIVDKSDYAPSEFEHVYVRRMKKDVVGEVGSHFPERLEPKLVEVPCSDAENEVFAELGRTWLHPTTPRAPLTKSGVGEHLFASTLLKGACSSMPAIKATVRKRIARLDNLIDERPDHADADAIRIELTDLRRLLRLVEDAIDTSSTKLQQLVAILREIGIGKKSDTRVVVFSERVDTLKWLGEQLPEMLKMPEKHFAVFHGQLTDVDQHSIIEQFKLATSDLRVLLAGDVASEGVNLHSQCHQLIHFDIPWSIITIDQRNGRIDRYGQVEAPEIRALLAHPDDQHVTGDLKVLKKLVEKEHEAHMLYGEAQSLLGKFDKDAEERELLTALERGEDVEAIVEACANDAKKSGGSMLDRLLGVTHESSTSEPIKHADAKRVFDTDAAFLGGALELLEQQGAHGLDIERAPERSFVSFAPPSDLKRRLRALPQDYLRKRGVLKRIEVTSDAGVAQKALDEARQSEISWPQTSYLSPLHPVLTWASDRVMSVLDRGTAPVIVSDAIAEPMFLLAGQWSNGRGQAVHAEVAGVYQDADGVWQLIDLDDALHRAGIGEQITNAGIETNTSSVEALLPSALSAFRELLDVRRDAVKGVLDVDIKTENGRADRWRDAKERLASSGQMRFDMSAMNETAAHVKALNESRQIIGDPVLFVLAAVMPAGGIDA